MKQLVLVAFLSVISSFAFANMSEEFANKVSRDYVNAMARADREDMQTLVQLGLAEAARAGGAAVARDRETKRPLMEWTEASNREAAENRQQNSVLRPIEFHVRLVNDRICYVNADWRPAAGAPHFPMPGEQKVRPHAEASCD